MTDRAPGDLMVIESRRAFLRLVGLAPLVGPAVLRTLGRPVTTWRELAPGLSEWTYRIGGHLTVERSQRISADTVHMSRVITNRLGLVTERVTWVVRRGETIEGSTRYRP